MLRKRTWGFDVLVGPMSIGFVKDALEARRVEGRLELRCREGVVAAGPLAAVRQEASRLGLGLLVRKASAELGAAR